MAENKYENMNLDELREQIDAVDKEILKLFRERMTLSEQIAGVKKATGLPILDVEREKAKLDQIAKNVEDDLSGYTSKLYLTLADLSKAYQREKFDIAESDAEDGDDF